MKTHPDRQNQLHAGRYLKQSIMPRSSKHARRSVRCTAWSQSNSHIGKRVKPFLSPLRHPWICGRLALNAARLRVPFCQLRSPSSNYPNFYSRACVVRRTISTDTPIFSSTPCCIVLSTVSKEFQKVFTYTILKS